MKVLLIHGLNRTPASLFALGTRMESAGWRVSHFGYVAFLESFDQISLRLRQHICSLGQGETYGVVAHSLGGLLLRAALGHDSVPQPAHVVMLGTPNQPPRIAQIAWKLPLYQWLAGQCGFNLTDPMFFQKLPPLRSPYTIIAGKWGPCGWFSLFGEEANDGIVSVSETLMNSCDRPLILPVEHAFMMNDAQVQAAIVDIFSSCDL